MLKVKPGHSVELFNGDGKAYQAIVAEATKSSVVVTIESQQEANNESPLAIHLAQVISRGEKMDLTIQKAVELGVASITPLFSERCGVQLSGSRKEKKIHHWEQIIYSACEQSRRNIIPVLHSPQQLSQWLAANQDTLAIMMHPNAAKPLPIEAISSKQSIHLLVGPEGGFSEQEVIAANEAGVHNVLLGPRVLRTETAALSMIAVLQYLAGDFATSSKE